MGLDAVPWSEFVAAAPEVAAVADDLWGSVLRLDSAAPPAGGPTFVIAYLATVRPDGGPRLHPFCPIVAGGRLFAAIPPSSPKGRDLRRDGRCVIHAMPGADDTELCIRAQAREVFDDVTRRLVVDTVARSGVTGMVATTRDHPLFEFQLERVDTARWLDVGQEGTRAVRSQWATAT
jgi:Pyridoxamine 5'-phosphate oxidase